MKITVHYSLMRRVRDLGRVECVGGKGSGESMSYTVQGTTCFSSVRS